MDYQLGIDAIARRAESLAGSRAIVGYGADGQARRSTWAETLSRARRLGAALTALGVRQGEPVATLCWNSIEHLEAYFGVPLVGAVLHTVNTRLSARDVAFILNDAGSRVLIVDETLLDLAEEARELAPLDHVIVVGDRLPAWAVGYEDLLAEAVDEGTDPPRIDERQACTLCYTSGTTGNPKGVVYSHRALAIQSLALMAVDLHGIRESDTILVVVPMFHANAWGHPYAAALAGATLVLPHRDLSPGNLLTLIERHGVTHTGGVSTVWEGVLQLLDAEPGRYDTSSLRILRFGGAPVAPSVMRRLEECHGIPVVQGFGMTEMSPMGSMAVLTSAFDGASADERWAQRAKQGRPIPFLDVRARNDAGLVPWDGRTAGELEVRGASVTGGYLHERGADSFTADGWLLTGDIVTIDPHGFIQIVDRAKDLIKSGGEWISSIALEASLCTHPAVVDAAVIAIPDARWGERPLACVVTRPGAHPTARELRDHLAPEYPSWWLPTRFEYLDEIPRTAAGKIRKADLRAALPVESGDDRQSADS